jgi:outer membrane protein TolC
MRCASSNFEDCQHGKKAAVWPFQPHFAAMPPRPNQPLRRVLLALILVLPATVRAQEVDLAGTMPEDGIPVLRNILVTALKQSPTMVQEDIAISAAEAGVLISEHGLWPSANVGGQYGTNRSTTTNGASNSSSGLFYNAGISQPVFQWGALENQARIGKIGLLLAKRSNAAAYAMLAVSLREQFFGLMEQKIALRNARFSQQLAQANLDVAVQRLKRGDISGSDESIADSAVTSGAMNLARLDDEYQTTLQAFASLAGMPGLTDADIPMDIPRPDYRPAVAETLVNVFIRDNALSTFQAQIYDLQIRQATLNYRIAEVSLLPKFGLGTSYSVENSVNAYPNQITQSLVKTFNYNANVNWSIFDGFLSRGEKLSALASRRAAERSLETYVDASEAQARHLVRSLAMAKTAQEYGEAGLTNSKWNLDHQTNEVKLGNAPRSVVDAARAALYDSELNNETARAVLDSQWSELVSLVGRDPAVGKLPTSYVRDTP